MHTPAAQNHTRRGGNTMADLDARGVGPPGVAVLKGSQGGLPGQLVLYGGQGVAFARGDARAQDQRVKAWQGGQRLQNATQVKGVARQLQGGEAGKLRQRAQRGSRHLVTPGGGRGKLGGCG